MLALSREVLATRRRLLGDAHPATRAALFKVSAALVTKRDLLGNLDICREVAGEAGKETVEALGQLAMSLFEAKDPKGAEPRFRELARLRRETLGAGHVQTALAVDNVAACCLLQGADASRRAGFFSLRSAFAGLALKSTSLCHCSHGVGNHPMTVLLVHLSYR